MEMKMSGPPGSGCKNRPPSRLQKHAPASLQLEQGAAAGAGTGAWGDGRAPIPLLSPLVVSPTVPAWEAAEGPGARREGGGDLQAAEGRSGGELHQRDGAVRRGGGGERQANDASTSPTPPPAPAVGAGCRHPALPTPVAEPASLVPMFQTHCGVEVRHAQQ